MTIATTTLTDLSFTANEKASALAIGVGTNAENLRNNAIQAVRDANKAVKLLDTCMETGNKTAVDLILTIIA